MSKTYYLTTSVPSAIKQLGNSSGWQREVVDILLSDKTEQDKQDVLRSLIAQKPESDNNSLKIDQLLTMMPKNTRSRARIFLHHVLTFLRVRDDGATELDGGILSSPLIDIVRYYCSPISVRVALPVASEHLERTFREHNVPAIAFARGRLPTNTHLVFSDTVHSKSSKNTWIELGLALQLLLSFWC